MAWLSARTPDGAFSSRALLRHAEWAALTPFIERTGNDPDSILPKLAAFSASVLDWNRRVSNLISRSDETRLVSRHLRESLEPAAWLAEAAVDDWIDFGSGAGYPALPLAMTNVGREWTLVESRRPKVLFLRQLIQKLGLAGVSVVHGRLEELVRSRGDDEQSLAQPARLFGGFTSRATKRLGPTLALAARIVRPGGQAFLWKGSSRADEVEPRELWNEHWTATGELALEGGTLAVCRYLRTKSVREIDIDRST